MNKLAMTLVGALMLQGGAVAAQDTGLVPRSSSPSGFRVENVVHTPEGAGAVAAGGGRGGMVPGAAPAASGGASQAAGAGAAVQIQGNTAVNASGRNVDSTVVGAQNRGCTHVGGIGDCR